MSTSPKAKRVTDQAEEAARLEIAANYLRDAKESTAPIGIYVQKAIDAALEKRQLDTSR